MCRFPEGCIPERTRALMKSGGESPIVSDFHVSVEKLVYGGDGLSRRDGRVVLTPYVLPGETVRVQAEQEKPGLVRARPLEILTASPTRVQAPCSYFRRCGGCQYQHAPYTEQLQIKRA